MQGAEHSLHWRSGSPVASSHLPKAPSWPRDPRDPPPDLAPGYARRGHRPLVQSSSCHLGERRLRRGDRWGSDRGDSPAGSSGAHRVVLLGDRGVGKSSLARIFAGISEKEEQPREDTYKRTLTVDGEETTLVVVDNWENDKLDDSQDDSLRMGSAYVIVYSVTDCSSFDSASELRITLRRARQAENIPIILVGNKSDLVRSREVAVEKGRACAMVFDCKFIETSASLQLNVAELFEGVVRQIRLRRDGGPAFRLQHSPSKPGQSITQKARRFLDRLVACNNQRVSLKACSKSCHDLTVL